MTAPQITAFLAPLEPSHRCLAPSSVVLVPSQECQLQRRLSAQRVQWAPFQMQSLRCVQYVIWDSLNPIPHVQHLVAAAALCILTLRSLTRSHALPALQALG